jgi:hypothetical protein
MGYWYEPEEVAGLAKKYGLHAQFVPSKLYPYRFHAVLTETQTNQPGRNQSVQSASNGAAVRRTQAFTAL